jgi:hypothetical protein
MVWFFHGRYKKHKYEDCKDFINMNWEEILNTDPSKIPFNILTNSCNLKKVGNPGYITELQLDAIKHLLEIKYLLKTKDPNYEIKKLDIINRFKLNNKEYLDDGENTIENFNDGEGVELTSLSRGNDDDDINFKNFKRRNAFKNDVDVNGGKKTKRRKTKRRKTKRRKIKRV